MTLLNGLFYQPIALVMYIRTHEVESPTLSTRLYYQVHLKKTLSRLINEFLGYISQRT